MRTLLLREDLRTVVALAGTAEDVLILDAAGKDLQSAGILCLIQGSLTIALEVFSADASRARELLAMNPANRRLIVND